MKYAFLSPHLRAHGSIRRIIDLTNHLHRRNPGEVAIFTPSGKPCQWLPGEAPVKKIKSLSKYSVNALVTVGWEEQRIFEAAIGAEASLKAWFVLGLPENNLDTLAAIVRGEQPGSFSDNVFRALMGRPDWLILANSTWQYEWMIRTFRSDIELAIGGLNTDIFYPRPVERDPWRILTSGDTRVREGRGMVDEALAWLQANVDSRYYLDTYHKRGLGQDEIAELYSSSALWLDGQTYAGWCNGVIEAMACGCPVVCTAIGGNRDFAIHGETALRCDVGDGLMMAKMAKSMLTTDLGPRLAQNAAEYVKRFGWATATDVFEEATGRWLKRQSNAPSA